MFATRSTDRSGAIPEQVPLEIRLHSPRPDVVVVWMSGILDAMSAPFVAERVGQQLGRAPHVVVDMHDVTFVGVHGLQVLRALHDHGVSIGTELHLVAEHSAVRRPLHLSGLDQVMPLSPSAELVVASRRADLRQFRPSPLRV